MLRSSPCSRSVRLSSYGCIGCCDRYDITASASRLPTLRFLAISPSSPWGVPPGGGTPVVMGDQVVRAGSSTVGKPPSACARRTVTASGGARRVVHGGKPALRVRPPQVGQVLAGEHG